MAQIGKPMPRLSYSDVSIGLRIMLGNACTQLDALTSYGERPEQLATAIKALLLASNASAASVPLLRARMRELARATNVT
jgi:hypothetical protein